MLIKLNFLILPIISLVLVYYVNSETNDGQLTEELDTNEFGDIASHIRKLTDPDERKAFKKTMHDFGQKRFRKGIDQGISKGISIGIDQGIEMAKGSHFIVYFNCFVSMVKHDCEKMFDYFKTVFHDNKSIIENEKIQLPKFFQELNDTHDKWMYEGIFKPATTTTAATDATTSYRPRKPKLLTYYQQWYYLAKIDCFVEPRHPLSLKLLQDELELLYSEYKGKYTTYDHLLQKFAGHMARSYIQMCALHHNGTSTVIDYGIANIDTPFDEILLDLIPSWYFSDEQLIFLDILHAALWGSNDNSQYEQFVIKNRWTVSPGKSETESVVIPYYDARHCNYVDLKATAPIGHQDRFTHEIRIRKLRKSSTSTTPISKT